MARTRRNFGAEFKTKVVLEIISGSKSAAEVCREYNLNPDLVSHWKNQFLAVVDRKNWTVPLGVELTRKEVYDAQETQKFWCRIQSTGGT